MTSENEKLALAKKCGAIVQDVVPYDHRPEYRTITFNEPTFLAFAAALEEKPQEQIARLRDALTMLVHNTRLGCSPEFIEKLCKQSDEVLSATQQSSEAFIAEVRAKELELRADHYEIAHGFDKYGVAKWMRQSAAELRNSAAKPEGKESKPRTGKAPRDHEFVNGVCTWCGEIGSDKPEGKEVK